MKNTFVTGMVTGVFLSCMVGMADASYIVNTGAGTGPAWSLHNEQITAQWLAGQFSIAQHRTITGIDAFLWGDQEATLTTALYTDDNGFPGNELFSTLIQVYNTGNGWFGTGGLNWSLGAGTYWVSFEVRQGDTYNGAQPGGAPYPLENEAFWSLATGNWHSHDELDLGIRISAEPVPLPGALLLFGTGIAGLAGTRLRRRKQQ